MKLSCPSATVTVKCCNPHRLHAQRDAAYKPAFHDDILADILARKSVLVHVGVVECGLIATDVVHSARCMSSTLCISIGYTGQLCKTAELIEMPFGKISRSRSPTGMGTLMTYAAGLLYIMCLRMTGMYVCACSEPAGETWSLRGGATGPC